MGFQGLPSVVAATDGRSLALIHCSRKFASRAFIYLHHVVYLSGVILGNLSNLCHCIYAFVRAFSVLLKLAYML